MDREFFKKLASEDPAPGGGTASALGGAMGAALLSMVAKLSRQQYPDAELVSRRGEELLDACLRLSKEDEDAFNAVVSAFKLPRKTDEERAARGAAVESALKKASEVPFQSAATALEVLREADKFLPNANKNALSDIGVAALFANAAAEGAIYNVLINLASLKDKAFVEKYFAGAEKLSAEREERCKKILDQVRATLTAPLKKEAVQ